MKLIRTFATLTTLALLASTAQAQVIVDYPVLGTGEAQIAGPASPGAEVEMDIALTVPVRYGLHLHRSTWNINLADLDADNTYSDGVSNTEDNGLVCWRAGQHDPATGRDVVYPIATILDNPSSGWVGDSGVNDANNPYDYAATLPNFVETGATYNYGGVTSYAVVAPAAVPVPDIVRADSYPGFVVSGTSPNQVLEWKGPIMCTFQTIVQKFSNVGNSNFTAELNLGAGATVASWPTTIVADRFTNPDATLNNSTADLVNSVGNGLYSYPVNAEANVATLVPNGANGNLANFDTTSTTGGWLDDNVLVALVFDGREVGSATVQNAQLQFNLFTPVAP